jgi:hypothetical protein
VFLEPSFAGVGSLMITDDGVVHEAQPGDPT